MNKPIIAIPMGDPNGIGPEIILKSMLNPRVFDVARPFVVGDRQVLEQYRRLIGCQVEIVCPPSPDQGDYRPGVLNLLSLDNVDMDALKIGTVQAISGRAAYEYIERATALALEGHAQAIATTPINKESLHAAEVPFIGHTEILAALTKTEDPLTMFEVRDLRVFFLSRHVSLIDAVSLCTKERIVSYLQRCVRALAQLGITEGTMAVAGLNPHCGEHGLFGNQEVEQIAPAVEQARAMGLAVAGPIGADSVFHQALNGKYNSVLSLYHDQGHIATKTLDFEGTISLTIGMPVLRTSVDHGTALDIAGTGIASERSMVEAIVLAAKYAPNYNAAQTAL